MARFKKNSNTEFCERVRFSPGWLVGNEEIFLSDMAAKGWMLSGVHGDTVYRFERVAPSNKIFAVEFLGKRVSVAEEIADDCNAGWDFIGLFGRKRYYCCDAASPALAHPSADSDSEQMKLSSTMTNLTTILLLNIPGTLYCLLYTVMLLASGGLMMADQLTYQYIYVAGAILGLVSIYIIFRWILAARKRNQKIAP